MDTVDVPVKISAKYMRDNAEKRGVQYAGGRKHTTLEIKSDAAIIGGRPDRISGGATTVDIPELSRQRRDEGMAASCQQQKQSSFDPSCGRVHGAVSET